MLSVGTNAQFSDPNGGNISRVDNHDKEVIEWWLAAGRGLWSGYMKVQHRGFYTLDKKCMDREAEDEINTIL